MGGGLMRRTPLKAFISRHGLTSWRSVVVSNSPLISTCRAVQHHMHGQGLDRPLQACPLPSAAASPSKSGLLPSLRALQRLQHTWPYTHPQRSHWGKVVVLPWLHPLIGSWARGLAVLRAFCSVVDVLTRAGAGQKLNFT